MCTDPVKLSKDVIAEILKAMGKIENQIKGKGLRADILATKVMRQTYKIPFYIVKGTKEHRYVRTQQYKSGNFKEYLQSYEQAYKMACKMMVLHGIEIPNEDDPQSFYDFCYLHFPIKKVICVAEDNGLMDPETLKDLKTRAAASETKGKGKGRKNPSTQNQLRREVTSMKAGYIPMASENSWFLPLFRLTKKIVDQKHAERGGNHFQRLTKVLVKFQDKLESREDVSTA